MKKPLIVTCAVAALALVVWLSLRESHEKGKAVELEAASRRTISSRVKATGEITPEKKVEISAKVVGEIINLPVHEGDHVHAGQLLLEIERDVYEASRDQARAALDGAQVSLERLHVQQEDAQRTLRRTIQLHTDGLASQQQLDAAQLKVDTARVEIEAQRHAIAQYSSALRRAEDDLARTTIRSPMDGVVIQLDAEKGETVVPGSTNLPGSVIMTIADMSRLLAEVEVSEVDVVDVALGQSAEITVDALGDNLQHGEVVEIATSGRTDAVQGTNRFAVKVAVTDPAPELRPTMTAKVEILTATRKDVVSVPIQAVVERRLDEEGHEMRDSRADARGDSTDVVYVLDQEEARLRAVDTGVSDDLYVEITDGLDENDQVVVGPYRTLKRLRDGDAIHRSEATTEGGDQESGEDEGS